MAYSIAKIKVNCVIMGLEARLFELSTSVSLAIFHSLYFYL
ncbi:hypothetical protein MYAER_2292 [Microcystis aeruginosa NIES-2549]|uniref:Uncharacterized protein n=1 Tax=Microcystis aeruginosa NIES-2549 TaxID=1641812 RepID=A0A0F6U539_MICAE|nr:hypothetical protein MYAER_2292 [Microcystis aeruginosa NIES-2549]AOC53034.1 hypothetical protein amyaer_2319 [Microcystis aeruginosa NIES-2481]